MQIKPLVPVWLRSTPAAYSLAAALTAASFAPASSQMRGTADVTSARAILSVDRLHAGAEAQGAVLLKVEPGWHVNAHQPGLDYLIPTKLELKPADGVEIAAPVYPQPLVKKFEFAGESLPVYEGEVAIRFRVRALASARPGPRRAEGILTAQACSDNLCLAPSRIPVTLDLELADPGAPVAPLHPQWFKPGAAGGSSGTAPPPAGTAGPASAAGNLIAEKLAARGWWLTLGFIFLGGLGLNLTPCVYPLIPITVSYFGAQAPGQTLSRTLLAFLYVAGMAATYSGLGVAAALTGGILGASLQSPWVLGGIAALMTALALSFFGLYDIQLPSILTSRLGSRQGMLGALLMGLSMGLVAAPCVGPFVIPLLAYVGATGDPWQGLAMFMALSLGLGAPFLVLAMGAASISRLPRAGEWMVGVKHVFGVALLGMAVYFAAPLLPRAAAPWALPGFLLLAALHFTFFEHATGQLAGNRALRFTGAAVALALAVAIGWPAPPGIGWLPFDAGAVEAARAAGRPVIIDFYADWCLPCKELDRITYRDPRVVAASAGFTTLKADLTHFTAPAVEDLRRQYEILGVPTVLFLDAAGDELRRLRATGYVRPAEFYARMREANPAEAGRAEGAGPALPPDPREAGAAPRVAAEAASQRRIVKRPWSQQERHWRRASSSPAGTWLR